MNYAKPDPSILNLYRNILFGQGRVMVLNATFNLISVRLLRSILLVEETGLPGVKHGHVASHWQTLSHNVASSTFRLSGIRTHTFVVKNTNCIGSCISNYHTITTTTAHNTTWDWYDMNNYYKYILKLITNTNLLKQKKTSWSIHLCKLFRFCMLVCLWKVQIDIDCQQFHHYQQNNHF